MPNHSQESFWGNFPAILTAIAALIASLTGIWAIHQTQPKDTISEQPKPSNQKELSTQETLTAKRTKEYWDSLTKASQKYQDRTAGKQNITTMISDKVETGNFDYATWQPIAIASEEHARELSAFSEEINSISVVHVDSKLLKAVSEMNSTIGDAETYYRNLAKEIRRLGRYKYSGHNFFLEYIDRYLMEQITDIERRQTRVSETLENVRLEMIDKHQIDLRGS